MKSCPESISDPLILRYHEDSHFTYVLLIHELVHTNLEGNAKLRSREDLEVHVNVVVMQVLNRSPRKEKLLEAAKHERNWSRMMRSGVELKDETLADLLRKKK